MWSVVPKNVADDIVNNSQDDYGNKPSPSPYAQTSDEIDRNRIEESKEYLKREMQIRSKGFETIQNIDKENKKELVKAAADPWDGQYVNVNINPSDYTRDDNNITIPGNIPASVTRVIYDIINNNNEILDEAMVKETVTEPTYVTVQETPTGLTKILTNQNDVEDIYIDDEDIIQENYKSIFTSDLSPAPEPDNVTYETNFFGSCAVKPLQYHLHFHTFLVQLLLVIQQ